MTSPIQGVTKRVERTRDELELHVPAAVPRLERAADLVIRALVRAGVDVFFGVPGGPASPLFDAILRSDQARLVESRHETHAAFAAAGYYRSSGRTAAVVVTAGPGLTNVVTGVASAHFERVPMLILAGDVAWAAEGGRILQDSGPAGVSAEQLLRGLTRSALRVPQAQSAEHHALAALSAARDPQRPGPSLLVVPIHLSALATAARHVHVARVASHSQVSRRAVEETARLLARARRPLLVFGAGARAAASTLALLPEALQIPFVTTPRAKGIVSETNAWSLRNGGLAASRWARDYTERGVDAALVLGTDLDDCSIGATRYVAPDGELVHVDFDATVFNRNLPTARGVVADVAAFARSLIAVNRRLGLANADASEEVKSVKASPAFDVPAFASDVAPHITPYRALADLEAVTGHDARFVTDVGEHMLFALHYLTATDPGRFTIHLGLGSMGSGIASAIGLAYGDRSRRVICVCGDGGMQMAGMEALVALKERLPIVYVVFNDSRYNMVFHGYRQVFGREAPWATPPIDFSRWAQSFGLPAAVIERPGQLDQKTFDRLTADGPALIDVRIDPTARMTGGGRNEALLRMSMLGAAEPEHRGPGS